MARLTSPDKKYPSIKPLEVVVESNLELTTRDGVILRSDVYHPTDDQAYPSLVCRTPYNKQLPRYIETATDLGSRTRYITAEVFSEFVNSFPSKDPPKLCVFRNVISLLKLIFF